MSGLKGGLILAARRLGVPGVHAAKFPRLLRSVRLEVRLIKGSVLDIDICVYYLITVALVKSKRLDALPGLHALSRLIWLPLEL